MRKLLSVLVCSSLFGLCIATAAQAAPITIGSPLTATFAPVPFGGPFLATNKKLGESGANVTAPVSGVITSWRIVGRGGPFSLILLRPVGDGTYFGGATVPGGTVATYGLATFAADQPITAGETIGIKATNNSDEIGNAEPAAGSEFAYWGDPPTSTSATAPVAAVPNGELSFNATILPVPTIASLGTITGPTAGGTSVTISGANFAEVKAVTFGAVAATSFAVNSEGQVTAVSPAGVAGSVPVSVTTFAGTATSAQAFTYVAPPVLTCKVPKLTGKKLPAAKKKLKAADCKVGKITKKKGPKAKKGKVVGQGTKAGKVVPVGTAVKLTVGKG